MHNMKSTYVLGKFINYARKSNQNFTKVSMYFFGSAADPMVLKMISWYSNNGHLSYSETDVGTPIITRVRVPNKEKLYCVRKNLIEYKYVLVLWRRSVHFRSGSQMHMIRPHNSMKITEMFFSIHVIEKNWLKY